MRIMIVTDAWFPQTNGVVRTLAQTAAWLGRFGHEVRMLTPRDFRSIPCPTYPEIRLSLLPGTRGRPRNRCICPASPAHRDRGASRARGAAPLPASRHAIHDFVPHPVPTVSAGAVPHSDRGLVSRAALVPRRRGPLHGQHGLDAQGPGRARIQESVRLASRRRYGSLQAGAQGVPDAAPSDRRLRRTGGRREEHRGVPADALERQQDRHRRRPGTGATAGAVSAKRCSRAIDSGRTSRVTSRLRTSWSSRAAPIHSAWSISRPWPAGCRWPPIPVTGPIDVIEDGVTGALDRGLGGAPRGAR